MPYDAYFLGMHLVWWFIWLVVFVGIFGMQRWKKVSALDILQERYSIGEITVDEYNMRMEHFTEMIHQD